MAMRTVLVVDDDDALIRLLRAALGDEGYHVESATGDAALEVAKRVQPHLILLDILMPGLGGTALSKELRADPVTATIPIVAMSAVAQFPVFTDDMSVDDTLAKPFSLVTLYATVARWANPT